MKLSSFSQSRDNNFNLIRISAATAVLITHSFALVTGDINAEPLRNLLGMTLGAIAVDVFFIISGFLVTSSLLNKRNIIDFAISRALRIVPALFVMLIITVFGLGLFFTTLPTESYVNNSKTYIYFTKCLTLFSGVSYTLPGVFENNPYKNTINGSLWSMPFEIYMYTALALVWAIWKLKPKLSFFICTTLSILFIVSHFFLIQYSHIIKLTFMFFAGSAFAVFKNQIRLSRSVFWSFLVCLVFSAFNKEVFFIVYSFSIPYIVLYVAHAPYGVIRKYNQIGDYSYGVYIYAFPIQQSLIALVPDITILPMIVISFLATLLFAVLSWHLIEKPALNNLISKRIINRSVGCTC